MRATRPTTHAGALTLVWWIVDRNSGSALDDGMEAFRAVLEGVAAALAGSLG